MTGMKLVGLKQTLRALRELPDEIERSAVTSSLMEAAGPMVTVAKEGARKKSERLTRSIDIAPQDEGDAYEAHAALGPQKGKRIGAFYGLFVELGTGPRQHKSGKSTGRMPATPFLRPAFDAEKRQTVQRFGKLLWNEVRRAAMKVAAIAKVSS